MEASVKITLDKTKISLDMLGSFKASQPMAQGVVVLGGSVYSYIEGRKCYKSLTEIKDDIDVAVFVLPAPTVIEIMEQIENVKGAIIVSAGFKETGYAGTKLENELKEILDSRVN